MGPSTHCNQDFKMHGKRNQTIIKALPVTVYKLHRHLNNSIYSHDNRSHVALPTAKVPQCGGGAGQIIPPSREVN